mmetsp:Transcript_12929/g.22981  ORF Transcript_12929/g.22981 Transcript_12929/m.22981 type:complete len:202 (+) Transcript_12929:1166-1771(+)
MPLLQHFHSIHIFRCAISDLENPPIGSFTNYLQEFKVGCCNPVVAHIGGGVAYLEVGNHRALSPHSCLRGVLKVVSRFFEHMFAWQRAHALIIYGNTGALFPSPTTLVLVLILVLVLVEVVFIHLVKREIVPHFRWASAWLAFTTLPLFTLTMGHFLQNQATSLFFFSSVAFSRPRKMLQRQLRLASLHRLLMSVSATTTG